jgi:hypothetical protein
VAGSTSPANRKPIDKTKLARTTASRRAIAANATTSDKSLAAANLKAPKTPCPSFVMSDNHPKNQIK